MRENGRDPTGEQGLREVPAAQINSSVAGRMPQPEAQDLFTLARDLQGGFRVCSQDIYTAVLCHPAGRMS